MIIYISAILCVVALAFGQILFKASATALSASGTFFAIKPLVIFFSAMCLYGISSVAWVWLLQRVELGRIYPIMALAFVLVPVGSYFIFGERFQSQYFLGVAMIMFGIFVAVRA